MIDERENMMKDKICNNKRFTIRFVLFYLREKTGWLGIGYLIAALRQINNLNIECNYYEVSEIDKAVAETKESAPQIIGLSILQSELNANKQFAEKIKEELPDCCIVAGNKEVSEQPEVIMNWCPAIDVAAIGEGEETLVEIVQRIRCGEALEGCLGTFYRVGNKIMRNRERPLISDISSIAHPDRESTLPYMDNSLVRAFPVFTARGCKGNCSFCVADSRKVRVRSLKDVFEEIDELIANNNATYIVFGDSSFEDGGETPLERYEELLKELKQSSLNFRFLLSSRAETITPSIVAVMKELIIYGLDCINIGIESGNDYDLKVYNKITRMKNNRYALELLEKEKIPYTPYIIMFNPYSSMAGLRENIEFFHEFKLLYTFSFVASRFMAFSGARLTKRLFEDGLMKEGAEYPITDAFAYYFQDVIVEKMWYVTEKVRDMLPEHLKLDVSTCSDLLSLVNWLNGENNLYKDIDSVKNFSACVKQLFDLNDTLIYELFIHLLDIIDNYSEEEIIRDVENKITTANNVSIKLWKKVQQLKLMIIYQLKKRGDTPLRRVGINKSERS